jgi:hypothetical protein
MTYPSSTTIQNLNQENLNSQIKWTAYLGQTFSPHAVRFVKSKHSTDTFEYNTADSLSALAPYNRGATLGQNPVNTSVTTEPFQRFADSVVLDYQDYQSAKGVSQIQQQIRSIQVRILRELSSQFFNGNGSAPNLKGLTGRASTTISSGGALALAELYNLRYSVKPSNDEGLGYGGNAWFSHSKVLRALFALLSTNIGALEWVYDNAINVSVPYFLGMPWYVDDSITVSSNLTTVYAVNLNHLRILYSCNDKYPSDSHGLQVAEIPMQSAISEMGYLVTGIYAIQEDPGSVAKLQNVNVTGL